MNRDALHIRVLERLLRLYPRRFRERHGADVMAAARASARDGARAAAVLADALRTLGRAWFDVLWCRLSGLTPRAGAWTFVDGARVAVRGLRRRPLEGLAVVLTLAVALGANGAIHTVAHRVLLERLPYDAADRVVAVGDAPVRMVRADAGVRWTVDGALSDHPGVESAATYYADAGANLVAGDEASRVRMTQVSPSFFRVLGARMLLGAGLTGEGAAEAVLTHALWRTAFGSDAGVVGRDVWLNGVAYRIAGVAAEGVEFPTGTQLWLSDPPVPEFYGTAFGPSVVARLRPGAAAAVTRSLAEYSESRRAGAGEYAQYIRDPMLVPLRAHLTEDVRLPVVVVSAAAAAVLLLGCINAAGVSVARVTSRSAELAVRRALGAGRVRVFGQLLAELSVLAALAGVLSVAFAAAAVPLLASLLPAGSPGLDGLRADGRTLLFTAGATVVAALLAGVPPALAGARSARLNGGPDRQRGDERGRQRLTGILTMTQVALAVALVSSAALLARTLMALRAVPLGYDTAEVLTFSVRLPAATYPESADWRRYVEDVRARLAALPGVAAVGVTDRLPMADGLGIGGGVRRPAEDDASEVDVTFVNASADYFGALGVRLLAGRAFTDFDDAGTVIVSRQLTRTLFGDGAGVGRRVIMKGPAGERQVVVVGIAADARLRGVEEVMRPVVYLPADASFLSSPSFALRATGPPAALIPAVRQVLAETDPSVAPHALRTTGDAVAEKLAARRGAAVIALAFGAAALGLAVMAVYTLLAHGVARRRREVGIRLALGATARQVEVAVVARGLAWTFGGIVAGLFLSASAAGLIGGLLFGVAPRDARVFAGTAALVLLVAGCASWLPARRAGRVDPTESLRME